MIAGQTEPIEIKEPEEVIEIQVGDIESPYTAEEIEQMSRICFEEAGNQGYQGKRYVAAVILNRVESDKYPDTVKGVISQKGQFCTYKKMYNHKLNEECRQAVLDEIENRSDTEIIAFRTNHYHKGLKQAFKYKDHYFSK